MQKGEILNLASRYPHIRASISDPDSRLQVLEVTNWRLWIKFKYAAIQSAGCYDAVDGIRREQL